MLCNQTFQQNKKAQVLKGITEMFPNTLNKHLQTHRSHGSERIQAIKCLELERLSGSPEVLFGGCDAGGMWELHGGLLLSSAGIPGSANELLQPNGNFPWCCAGLINQQLDKCSQSNIKWASLSCVLSQCYSSTFHVDSKVKGDLERADICVCCAVKGNEHRGH